MNIKVFDRHFNPLTNFKIADFNSSRFSFNSDSQTYQIIDNVQLSTFKASFSKEYDDAKYLTTGNYLAFVDEWGKEQCFVINEITNEESKVREIYCEDIGLDLLNSASMVFTATDEQPIEYYLNRELYDSGWEIGTCEIKTKKKIGFDASSTTLKRLQDIAKAFECEIYFDVKFGSRGFKYKRVNVVKSIGLSRPRVRMTNGREITTLTKAVSAKELRTAVFAYGANGKDIADISYNDGRFKTIKGSNLIVDMDASQEWNRFPSSSNASSGYYEMVNNSESEDPFIILNDAIEALKAKNHLIATYRASFLFEPGKDISLGDWVQLVDPEYNPALYLESRVTSITISRTNPSSNTVEISNSKEIDDGISSRIHSLQEHQNHLNMIAQTNISWTMDKKISGDKMVLDARFYRSGQDITNEFDNDDFSWKKTTVNGPDEAFNQAHFGVGHCIEVDLNTIDRTADFTCTLLVHPFCLVSVSWFQSGLRSLATKIDQEREDDSTVVLFATDLHQALSSAIRGNASIFQYANNHIKNMVELTLMTDIDLMVLGGDIADGSTSKNQQKAALKQIVSTAGMSKCPVMVCKGNHDDNMWYAKTLSGVQYDMRNVVSPNEMTQLITNPIRFYDNMHVTDFQTAYIDIKNIRHIILNTSDVPYKLNANGNPMFYTLQSVAYSSKQLQWLVDTLASTPDNFKVCIYQHIGFGDTYSKQNYSSYNVDQLMQILDAFQHHKCIQVFNDDPNFKTAINADFTNNKATILYGMHGHYHNDKLMKWKDINIISTGCSAPIPRHLDGTGLLNKRELQTLSEDLFDVMIYTPSKKKIKLLRYGAGKDREIKL